MKKFVLIACLCAIFLISSLPAQESDANQAYIKAVTTADPGQKAQLLKDYIAKYSGKGTQYENFANAQLCLLAYPGKAPEESIEHGEKAIALGSLDDLTKYQVLIAVSGLYSQLGKNLEKAKTYAGQAVQVANSNKTKEGANPKQWDQAAGAAFYVKAQAMEKANDVSGAVDAYKSSYSLLKNKQVIGGLAKLGKTLYDKKSYADAVIAFRGAYDATKEFGYLAYLAKSLHRSGKKDEALKYYKTAFEKQKNGEMAYNIGIILTEQTKTNAALGNEAIKYLLSASQLSESYSKQAMAMAQSLFFTSDKKYNEKVKEMNEAAKNLEEQTNAFNKKFGEKDEDELTDDEKKDMEDMLFEIETLQMQIDEIQQDQQAALDKFNKLIEQTKQQLGIS